MSILTEMNEIAEKMKKSQSETVFSIDLLKKTMLELGPEGLRKALPHLSDSQKEILKSLLEDMKKSHKQLIANDKSVTLEPVTNSTPVGDYLQNEDVKPPYDKQDEAVEAEAEKRDQMVHKQQGGGAPVEGWEGQIIKGSKMRKHDADGDGDDDKAEHNEADEQDEKIAQERKKMLPKKDDIKNMMKRAQERNMEKGQVTLMLGKSYGLDVAELGVIWDLIAKGAYALVPPAEAAEQSRVPKQMKQEESVGVHDPEDPSVPKPKDSATKKVEMQKIIPDTEAPKISKSLWYEEDPVYFAKSQNPFAVRTTGQNVSYKVDEMIDLQEASQRQRLAKSTFDYLSDEELLTKGGSGSGPKPSMIAKPNYNAKPDYNASAAHFKAEVEAENAKSKKKVQKSDDPNEQVVEANAKKQSEAKKDDAEEIRQIKTDEKLSHIESKAGPKMPFIKGKMQKSASEEMIEKSLDMDQSNLEVAFEVQNSPNIAGFLVKSFTDADMDELFKVQDLWADDGKKN